MDKANAKLAITKEQAGRMKKKTAIAVKKAQQLTDKLKKESDLEKEDLRREAETASEAAGTQIRLTAAFADAVTMMAKKAKQAAVQLANAERRKKEAKSELIAAEKKKEIDEEFDSKSDTALGLKDDDENYKDDDDDDDPIDSNNQEEDNVSDDVQVSDDDDGEDDDDVDDDDKDFEIKPGKI